MEKQYSYRCLMRPPMPGAIPRDGLCKVQDMVGISSSSGHHYWGLVVYNRQLSDEEIKHFDLEPVTLTVENR